MNTSERRYFNRELSWIAFNERVLEEANDLTNPLLERVKFLAITSSNLDEFFMVRVGGLQLLISDDRNEPDASGMTPTQQLEAIRKRVQKMVREQYSCFMAHLYPQLSKAGIRQITPHELNNDQTNYLRRYFDEEIFAVASPMTIGNINEFPLLPNLGLNLVVRLEPGEEDGRAYRYAIIPFGPRMPRIITIPSPSGYNYMLLEDVIKLYIERFFPGVPVIETATFRITRNADMSVREDLAADLLAGMEDVLIERKMSDCVRLEIEKSASPTTLNFFKKSLSVADWDIYRIPGPLNLSAFMALGAINGFDSLKYDPWPPQPCPAVDMSASIFTQLAEKDILLCHPYESYEPVIKFIEEASLDPNVLAIKQILYRTSSQSPVVAALKRAAERGKYVTAIVELKARFDEARNIEWARELERAGAQVIYGVKGLKTHAKLCIVVRREPQGVVRYLHFGTGNYNELTAKIYSDISYMTTNSNLAIDSSAFFNAITGLSEPREYLKIAAAPLNLRERIVSLIEDEIARKRQGQEALIMAKMNSLVDPVIINKLYEASDAGVNVRLNVRGICCLRPGVPGLSENISVVSIVERFLEHSRIFYFYHGGEEALLISSADWMPRNLDRRVELLTPVDEPICRTKLTEILTAYFRDNTKARILLPDGRYKRLRADSNVAQFRSQQHLYSKVCEAAEQAKQVMKTTFVPHRPPEADE